MIYLRECLWDIHCQAQNSNKILFHDHWNSLLSPLTNDTGIGNALFHNQSICYKKVPTENYGCVFDRGEF